MMWFKIFLSNFLSVLLFTSLPSQGVTPKTEDRWLGLFTTPTPDPGFTHMPLLKEQELAPEVVEALKGPMIPGTGNCFYYFAMDAFYQEYGINHAIQANGPDIKYLKPCGICNIKSAEPVNFRKRENYEAYAIDELTTIIRIIFTFPILNLHCRYCRLTNDDGATHSGSINTVWKDPHVTVIGKSTRLEPQGYKFDNSILLINATNVNKEHVDVTCQGDDDTFNEVCKKADEKGELDETMHRAAEAFNKFEEKYFPNMIETMRIQAEKTAPKLFRCGQKDFSPQREFNDTKLGL